MSATVDTNVLVYATHAGSPHHPRSKALVEHLAGGPAIVYLLWPALLGYLRIITHPRILDAPLSTSQAIGNIENLVAMPHVRTPGEGPSFWRTFQRLAHDIRPRGKLVPDAHLVALMHDLGITTIWTRDRDFRLFAGIDVRDPFDEKYADGFA